MTRAVRARTSGDHAVILLHLAPTRTPPGHGPTPPSTARARADPGPSRGRKTSGWRRASCGGDPRTHLLAIYGFARLVDYLGDDYDGDRLAALDWLADRTERAFIEPPPADLHPLVADAVRTVRVLGADPRLLRDLIAANRQDQVVRGYATFDDLVDYCRLSANPVGRLVLGIFDAADADRCAWSDRICTGLAAGRALAGRGRGRGRRPDLPAGRRPGPLRCHRS